MQIINCHGWESNPGFLERKSGSKPTEPIGLLPDLHSKKPGFDSQPWQFIICNYEYY